MKRLLLALAMVLAACDDPPRPSAPAPTPFRAESPWQDVGGAMRGAGTWLEIKVIHDDTHHVTCWVTNQNNHGSGISCLPDQFLDP